MSPQQLVQGNWGLRSLSPYCGAAMISILSWDIGGANVKAVALMLEKRRSELVRVVSQPFEIWREKDRFPDVLHEVFDAADCVPPPLAMAITMTAELSDVFETKRDGVLFVLESLKNSFPGLQGYVLNLSGDFVPMHLAVSQPLEFAATNWLASALWVARKCPNCLLVDVGSTTTDILPIVDGKVRVCGRTDLQRLSTGELVYTGVLRTNLAAIVRQVPVAGRFCRVASEYFAVSGDVHLILGYLNPEDYTCTTPDGRPPSLDSARKRLARLVCADIEMLSTIEIEALARYLYAQQIRQVCEGMEQVISRFPHLRAQPAVVIGTGAYMGKAAAANMGLEIHDLSNQLGHRELSAVPCLAAAHLLVEHLKIESK
jgi:probable H4MPT-linked C1 transfer pathway protein